jgi:hypothetical protein
VTFDWVDLLSLRAAFAELGLQHVERDTGESVWCVINGKQQSVLRHLAHDEHGAAADGGWTDLAVMGVITGGVTGVTDPVEAGCLVAESTTRFSAIADLAAIGPVRFSKK